MLYGKLKAYAQSGVYPFHMPGHKRQPVSDALPYELDLTEIPGFDDLHRPDGCIRTIEEKAAALYGVKRAFLLINGATGGLLAAVRAMTQAGDKVLLARNCHRSVYHAAELCALIPLYLLPERAAGTDFCGSIDPDSIREQLEQNNDIKLVIVTSPTYEGVCSDIAAIAAICHSHCAKLLVDEAHGAHFPFSDSFPRPAVACGADGSVISLHKTLPAPTQTALLLTNDAALEAALRRELQVFETSSPSYLLMSGIEICLDAVKHADFEGYTARLRAFYEQARRLKSIELYEGSAGVFDFDFGKLVIMTGNTGLTGAQLAQTLREEYAIETEMAGADHVIAMTSVCDTEEGFTRLIKALSEIDKRINNSEKEIKPIKQPLLPVQRCSPWEARQLAAQNVSLRSAVGQIGLDYVYAYPPGIPYLVPGEVIGADMPDFLLALMERGVSVSSTGDDFPNTLRVAKL